MKIKLLYKFIGIFFEKKLLNASDLLAVIILNLKL